VPVAAAIAGAAVIGGGASIISANKAASSTSSAANSANALQASIYNSNKDILSPYASGGTAAMEQLRRILGLGDSNTGVSVNGNPALSAQEQQQGALNAFMNNGSYDFGLNQGLKAVQAGLGAKGYLDSGAAQKSLLTYGNNFAQGALQQYIGNLQNLSGQGLSAGSALAGVGQSYANASNANTNAAGNASANAALATGGVVNNALGSAASSYALNQALGSSYGSSSGIGNYGLGNFY
jgi:hypothetical protein